MNAIKTLRRLFGSGAISRRQFVVRTGALGLATTIPAGLSLSKASASEPKSGGQLRQAVKGGSTTDSLDGATLIDTHNQLSSWQFRNCLTEVLPNSEVTGELAESWESTPDAKTWVFHLRRGVEFHNGKTLDADDVIYSINHHRGPDAKTGASGAVAPIEEIVKDDKETVVFHLKEGNADFPYLMSDYHLVIAIGGTQGNEWDKGIGTGPFILTAWEPGVRSVGKRNPNYFKEGCPYFDEVETLNINDPTARMNALRSNDVDVIEEPDLATLHLLSGLPDVELTEVAGNKHYIFPMRTDQKPFNDNNVRMAIKHAVDRDALLKTILRGHGYIGNDHPIGRNQKFFAEGLPLRHYDPEKAKHYLKQAGFESLSVELYAAETAFAGATDASVLLKEHMSKAGIDVKVVQAPSDGYWSDVWMNKPWCASFWNGRTTADWMFSTAYAEGASWNETYWNDERFNQLLSSSRSELDDTKRAQMYAEMQQIVRDEGGALIPIFPNLITAHSTTLQQPELVASDWPLDGLRLPERWWFV